MYKKNGVDLCRIETVPLDKPADLTPRCYESYNYMMKKLYEKEDYILFLERVEENEREFKDYIKVFNERNKDIVEVWNSSKEKNVLAESAIKLRENKIKKRKKWISVIEKIIEQSYKRDLKRVEKSYKRELERIEQSYKMDLESIKQGFHA